MKVLLLVLFIGLYPFQSSASESSGLCSAGKSINFPQVGKSPLISSWRANDADRGEISEECLRLLPGAFKLSVAAAARIKIRGGADAVLDRFGAISTMVGIKYWSLTDRAWKTLIVNAAALDGPDGQKRQDFKAGELRNGDAYFSQQDNRTPGAVTYRMHLLRSSADQVVINVTNVTSVKFHMVPLFRPGDLQSVYILRKVSPDEWTYLNISGAKKSLGFLGGDEEGSFRNRVFAFYRHFSAFPMEQNDHLAR